MSYMDFSSWPREQEQTFVVFEQRTSESLKKALGVGAVAGVAWFVVLVGIYLGVKPDIKEIKGMNMDNLTKKSKKTTSEAAPTPDAPKPAAAPAAAPTPAPAAPAAAPAEEKK
jgi:hypothetical protein